MYRPLSGVTQGFQCQRKNYLLQFEPTVGLAKFHACTKRGPFSNSQLGIHKPFSKLIVTERLTTYETHLCVFFSCICNVFWYPLMFAICNCKKLSLVNSMHWPFVMGCLMLTQLTQGQLINWPVVINYFWSQKKLQFNLLLILIHVLIWFIAFSVTHL